jgi:hypothetical protein
LIEELDSFKIKKWKGFRLLAFDGTTALLPASRQIKTSFGIHSQTDTKTVNCLAQCLLCVDVLSDYILGFRLDKMVVSEKEMFREMLPKIPQTQESIILLDRGFGYFNIAVTLLNSGFYFCIRMSSKMSTFTQLVMNDKRVDFETDWYPSDKEKSNTKKYNLSTSPIKVRVTKITLSTGEVELLISNLSNIQHISTKEMGELYYKRWQIEESIKKIKPKMKLEFWGCKKEKGIQQEFLANVFMYNLSCFLGNQAQVEIDKKTTNRKIKYKYNWQNAYRFTREKMVLFCFNIQLIKSIKDTIVQISQSIIALIDTRKFPRNDMRKNKSRSYQCYK